MVIKVFEDKQNIRAFFTTRQGGMSPAPYDSLNFGGSTEDLPENTRENRERVFEEMGLSGYVAVRPSQVHGDHIECIAEVDVSKLRGGNSEQNELLVPDTDGLITGAEGVILTTVHADCLAVILADAHTGAIGLVHAGWRGTLEGIAVKAANRMVSQLGAEKERIEAFISPGISDCCFEVGAEVYEAFKEKFSWIDDCSKRKEDGKYLLDLKEINRSQLLDCGISDIAVSPLCTSCRPDLFFSYRRDGSITGRMGAGIALVRP